MSKRVRCKSCGKVWRAGVSGTSHDNDLGDTVAGTSQLSGTGTGETGASQPTSNPDNDQTWIGHTLGRFQISNLLGKGAMGVVFNAHDPGLKRNVALKILTKQFIRKQKTTYRLEQFVREAQSAARLSHPNSVTVYEIGQDKGWYFIAMEVVLGGTLLDLVRKHKKLVPIGVVCELIAQAGEALSAAHKLGIIHRDVKPTNLMLTTDGRTKVADFGLVQIAEQTAESDLPSKAVGTPYWMSPEQCKGESAIPQSDIYSLGAVLFFALTGEVPYKGNNKRDILLHHVNTAVPDPRKYRKDIPESLVNIIRRAMAKNPQERYSDAAEMALGLRQVAGKLAQARIAERWWDRLAAAGTGGTQTSGRNKRRPMATIGLITLLLAALVGGLVLWNVLNKPTEPTAKVTIPVVVVRTRPNIYHVEGAIDETGAQCPILNDVPADMLIHETSEQAREAGRMPCRYCRKEIARRLKRARTRARSNRK